MVYDLAMVKKSSGRRIIEQVEKEAAAELERKRKRKKRYPKGANTSIAKDVRARKRTPPPVPEGMTLAQIRKLDPDDPRLKVKPGRKRKVKDPDDWPDAGRAGKRKRTNARRAKVRKHETETIATVTEIKKSGKKKISPRPDVDDEVILVEEGVLSLDDWDNEELIRGYRRKRSGKFGPPPKFVPRELQQEIMRRILKRGERKFAEAYLRSLDNLVKLADGAESEKVQLEAIKEIQNRFAGKIPDRLLVSPDAPYQDMLADSLVPVSDVPPLELEMGSDGVARAAPIEEDDGSFETGGRDA